MTHHAIRSRGDDVMAKLGLNADLPFEEGILGDRQVNGYESQQLQRHARPYPGHAELRPLIKAQAANPDVIIFLVQGDDMLNALKQAVQFGLESKVHLAGAQQEMEPLEGLPPEARIGTWVMEWYWNQPGVPHVAEFVAEVKKRTGRVPTARTWFGFVSTGPARTPPTPPSR